MSLFSSRSEQKIEMLGSISTLQLQTKTVRWNQDNFFDSHHPNYLLPPEISEEPKKDLFIGFFCAMLYLEFSYPFPSVDIAGAAVFRSPYIQRWKIRQPSILIIPGNKRLMVIIITASSDDDCPGVRIRNGTR